MKTETIKLIKLQAEEGMVFKNKESEKIMGETIYLGIHDSAENYEEVEKPISEENDKQ